MSRAPTLLIACTDLFFASRIQSTAQQLGATWTAATWPLAPWGEETTPDLAIVDLDGKQLPAEDVIRELRSRSEELPIVAFVQHDRVDAIRMAREAGASRVYSRGAFSQKLPDLVGGIRRDTMGG
jgi:DNA-binding NarL/FixJ family response regulator